MKIGVLATAKGGVGLHRIINPHKALMSKAHVVFMNNYTIDEPLDIIFTHGSICLSDDAVSFLLKAKNSGLKIVVDVDDHWVLPYGHAMYNLNANNFYANRYTALLKLANLVTTTTKYLRKEVLPHNKNVVVLPNALNESMVNFEKDSYFDNGRLKLGWIGGSSHLEDIKLIDSSKIMSKLDKINAQFILAGFTNDVRGANGEVKSDPTKSVWPVYESILTNKYAYVDRVYSEFLLRYEKNKSFYNSNQIYIRRWAKDEKKYLSFYKDIDISIVPLQATIFNGLKSELKIVEAGWNKKPVIASNIKQYADVLKDGGGILIDNKKIHKDMWPALLEYRNNPNKLVDDGEKLYEICQLQYNIDKVSEDRLGAYSLLI